MGKEAKAALGKQALNNGAQTDKKPYWYMTWKSCCDEKHKHKQAKTKNTLRFYKNLKNLITSVSTKIGPDGLGILFLRPRKISEQLLGGGGSQEDHLKYTAIE